MDGIRIFYSVQITTTMECELVECGCHKIYPKGMNDGGETAGSELRLRAEVQLRRYDCVADISKALYLKNRILEEETKNSLLLWRIHGLPCYIVGLRSLLHVCEHGWKLTLGQPTTR